MFKKVALGLSLFVSSVFAASPVSLDSLLSNFQSLQANFAQISQTQGQASQQVTGTLAIQKPNRFRWEVLQPNPQLIVADGKNLWNYEEDLQQVTVSPIGQALSNTPMLLLSGEVTQIKALFNVQALSPYQYQLTPKQADNLLKSVVIGFDQNGRLASLILTNNMGQVTQIQFNQVKLNPALPAKLFQFIPPNGADVLS
ncbi:MAG: outer rane lipoprotein carrier protein LolA [Gammaproteobacteria bacterium]|jgi:outer membrane lipoprotein carrier protein|nr:outer rane lipoprotein carrier protein LolA [Gammaproteobacteria bacterium]